MYTRSNFPIFMLNDGHWDICRNKAGKCAAIVTALGASRGCVSTPMGDIRFVRKLLRERVLRNGAECRYVYRNLPVTTATWAISGHDVLGGSGVLEWCSSAEDAQDRLGLMRTFLQFYELKAEQRFADAAEIA